MHAPKIGILRDAVGVTIRASILSPEGLSAVTITTAPLPSEAQAVVEFSRVCSDVLSPEARTAILRALRRELEVTKETPIGGTTGQARTVEKPNP